MDLIRIGSKLISRSRMNRRLNEILQMRVSGKSQQETAEALGVDRSFISRLEALGEVRKGGRVALIGFPIENKAELEAAALAEGVDFLLLFTDEERRRFAEGLSGGTSSTRSCGSVPNSGHTTRWSCSVPICVSA